VYCPDIQISDLTDSDNITKNQDGFEAMDHGKDDEDQHQSGSSMLDDHARALQLQVDLDGEDSVQPVAGIYSDACSALLYLEAKLELNHSEAFVKLIIQQEDTTTHSVNGNIQASSEIMALVLDHVNNDDDQYGGSTLDDHSLAFRPNWMQRPV
jgi:hypothetical protein